LKGRSYAITEFFDVPRATNLEKIDRSNSPGIPSIHLQLLEGAITCFVVTATIPPIDEAEKPNEE